MDTTAYHPNFTRPEAENYLRLWGKMCGDFVVRDTSKNNGCHVISHVVAVDGTSRFHHTIVYTEQGMYYVEPALMFRSMNELLAYYYDNALAAGCKLKAPVPRSVLPKATASSFPLKTNMLYTGAGPAPAMSAAAASPPLPPLPPSSGAMPTAMRTSEAPSLPPPRNTAQASLPSLYASIDEVSSSPPARFVQDIQYDDMPSLLGRVGASSSSSRSDSLYEDMDAHASDGARATAAYMPMAAVNSAVASSAVGGSLGSSAPPPRPSTASKPWQPDSYDVQAGSAEHIDLQALMQHLSSN